MYYVLEAEVCGSFGEDTIRDTSVFPPKITKLDIVFEGWLGDDLIETFPAYMVTERLKKTLGKSELTGFDFDIVSVKKSKILMSFNLV